MRPVAWWINPLSAVLYIHIRGQELTVGVPVDILAEMVPAETLPASQKRMMISDTRFRKYFVFSGAISGKPMWLQETFRRRDS